MAISNIGETWHLRYLESYVALLLELKELSNSQKVRDSKNIKPAIEHAGDAINQPNLLTEPEKTVIKEFLSELQFTYHACSDKAGNDKYVCETIGGSNWRDELIVLEARIKGSFFPKIQQMAFSRTTGLKASDNKAGNKMEQIQYQDFLVKIAQQVDDLLIQDISAINRFQQHLKSFADKKNKHTEWLKMNNATGIGSKGEKAYILPSRKEIPAEYDDPACMFVRSATDKHLSEPKSKNEEYQLYYIILAIIHDQVFPEIGKINNILSKKTADFIWGILKQEVWDSIFNRAFIEQALERVKADKQASGGKAAQETLTNTEQNSDKTPNDLMDLAKAVSTFHRSRAQLKRDIDSGEIKSYRKKPKGKHYISESEANNIYLSKDSIT